MTRASTGPDHTPYPEQKPPDDASGDRVYDCAVVGGGPAGLAAAIYVARYNRSVIVADFGEGRSTTYETNENYLGFPDGVKARDLRRLGQQQARRFGAEFVDARVESIDSVAGVFALSHDGETVRARTVILATGVVDRLPRIPDIEEYFGRCIFWCITCDGYKTRGKHTLVVGDTDDAATTCLQFLAFTPRLTFLTNCPAGASSVSDRKRTHLADAGIPFLEGRIDHVDGKDGQVRTVRLDTGDYIHPEMLFFTFGCDPNVDLALQLGVKLENGFIETDQEQRTNVPGVYAAGDVTRAFAHQVVTAAHEGATAGTTANYDLYAPEQQS